MSNDASEPDPLGNIYNDFPGYSPVAPDHEAALRSGLVALDANVLLNLYRYTDAAREMCLDVFAALADRLFVPHQAMAEFWSNRETVISDRHTPVEEVVSRIEELGSQMSAALATWANRMGLPPEQRAGVDRLLTEGNSRMLDHLRSFQGQTQHIDPEDHAADPVLIRLAPLLEGKVGRQTHDHGALLKECQRRLDAREPPGFMDSKKGDRATGDCLAWLQTVAETKVRGQKTLVFVTDDSKEDWWRIEGGQRRGARPELSLELQRECDARLHLMRLPTLLHLAKSTLGVDVSPASMDQVSAIEATSAMPPRGWTPETAARLLSLLKLQAPVQRAALLTAVKAGGFVSRDEVYTLGNYPPSRTLRGFTRPVRRLVQQMQEDALLSESAPEALQTVYDSNSDAVNAAGFRCPTEFLEAARAAMPTRRDPRDCKVTSVRRLDLPTQGDYSDYEISTNIGTFVLPVSGSAQAQHYDHSLEAIVSYFAEQQVRRTEADPGSRLPEMLMSGAATEVDDVLTLLD